MAQPAFNPLSFVPPAGGVSRGIGTLATGIAQLGGAIEGIAKTIKTDREVQEVYEGAYDEFVNELTELGDKNASSTVSRYLLKPAKGEKGAILRLANAGNKLRKDVIAPLRKGERQGRLTGLYGQATAGDPGQAPFGVGQQPEPLLDVGATGLGERPPRAPTTTQAATGQFISERMPGVTQKELETIPGFTGQPETEAAAQKQQADLATAQAGTKKKLWEQTRQERDLKIREEDNRIERIRANSQRQRDSQKNILEKTKIEVEPLDFEIKKMIERKIDLAITLGKKETELKQIEEEFKATGVAGQIDIGPSLSGLEFEIDGIKKQLGFAKDHIKNIKDERNEILKHNRSVKTGDSGGESTQFDKEILDGMRNLREAGKPEAQVLEWARKKQDEKTPRRNVSQKEFFDSLTAGQ